MKKNKLFERLSGLECLVTVKGFGICFFSICVLYSAVLLWSAYTQYLDAGAFLESRLRLISEPTTEYVTPQPSGLK